MTKPLITAAQRRFLQRLFYWKSNESRVAKLHSDGLWYTSHHYSSYNPGAKDQTVAMCILLGLARHDNGGVVLAIPYQDIPPCRAYVKRQGPLTRSQHKFLTKLNNRTYKNRYASKKGDFWVIGSYAYYPCYTDKLVQSVIKMGYAKKVRRKAGDPRPDKVMRTKKPLPKFK